MSDFERWIELWKHLLVGESSRLPWIGLAFAVLTVAELAVPAERGQRVSGRLRNLVYLTFYFLLGLGALAAWYTLRPPVYAPDPGRGNLHSVLLGLAYLGVFDFIYYWYHRAQHRFPFLWAIHELHHAEGDFNVTTSFRSYWLELPVQFFLVFTPALLLLGPDDLALSVVLPLLTHFFLLLTHANLRIPLGPLTPLLAGPQLHRIHHSRLDEHQDRNFAQIFPLLDVLFGTYRAPGRNEYPPTGTPGLASNASFGRALLQPFAIWGAGLVHLVRGRA